MAHPPGQSRDGSLPWGTGPGRIHGIARGAILIPLGDLPCPSAHPGAGVPLVNLLGGPRSKPRSSERSVELGMAWIRVRENEPIDGAIRRFKKQCEKAGILKELRKREHYEKPSVRRKKKAIAARKRAIRRTERTPSRDHR